MNPDIPFSEALRVWMRVAALSFGGPAGQIAVMHRILVVEKRWISEAQFLHALNFCMLLPGPEATQLAVYIGWLLHRTRGGVTAGVLFVLPGFLSILALSFAYVALRSAGPVAGALFGLKAAVLAIVLEVVVRIGRRALAGPVERAIAAVAFLAIFAFGIAFPLIVAAAALAGFALLSVPRTAPEASVSARPSAAWALRVSGTCLLLWLGPVALLFAGLGADHVFTQLALFFSRVAVVSFGGAYAVLGYVAQEAVQGYGWLAPGEMLDGLGLAETTPGPLIQVVQFVGFLAAFRDPGGLDPYVAGVFAAVLVTWVTFTPSFLWIFLGAPWIERLRGNARLSGALAAITAAVVGVILNLALWFAVHTLFGEVGVWQGFGMTLDVPRPQSLDPAALLLTLAALGAVFGLRLGMFPVLAGAAGLGLALWAAGAL